MARNYEYKIRYDAVGKLRMIACAEGYVMVRRPRAMPFVMDGKEWTALPTQSQLEERGTRDDETAQKEDLA